jgi:hypothetical protein
MPTKPAQSIQVRGTLTFTPADPPRPLAKYVVQRVGAGFGNVAADPTLRTQIRAHVIPLDPQTTKQLARRATFAAAVLAWHALPPADRAYWRERGAKHGLPGFNAFLSFYLRTH